MNEEFYSSIKLVSGEEIFAITSTDDEHPDTLILSVEYYTNYLIEQAEERELGGTVAKGGRKVKPTKTMGYLGNVDQAKEKLEQCLALEMDPKAGIATHV